MKASGFELFLRTVCRNRWPSIGAQKLQAGLYPNPTVGHRGDEIRGGSYGGGEQGFFVQQPIILGGKLALDRKVRGAEEKQRQVGADAQRQRVENDVRMAYYRVLAAQERLALKQNILAISQSTVRIVGQLGRIGQAGNGNSGGGSGTAAHGNCRRDCRTHVAAGVDGTRFRRRRAIVACRRRCRTD